MEDQSKVQLVVKEGPDMGRIFKLLDGQTISFGRGSDNDAVLADGFASRRHCEISMQNGNVVVQDCGSSGGTFVNDQKIESHQLQTGDIVGLGHTRLLLRDYRLLDGQSIGLAPLKPPEPM